MRHLELGERRFSVEMNVPSDFRAVVRLQVRVSGLARGEGDLALAVLKKFESAARHRMFADPESPVEASAEVVPAATHDSFFQCDIRLAGQHPLVARVLLNLLCQSFALNAGDVVQVAVETAGGAKNARWTENDVMRVEYPEFYERYPFKVTFSGEGGVPRDPVVRITFVAPISKEGYAIVVQKLRMWDSILEHGGYANPSDELMPVRPFAPEIYLVSPTVLEHPVFGFTQSAGSFCGLCSTLSATAGISRITSIEVQ